MVKVRHTKIDDVEQGKKQPKQRKADKEPKAKKPEAEFEDTLDDDDEPLAPRADDDEDKRPIRHMLLLQDFGALVSVWSVTAIDKVTEFVEKPRPRWQYGIVINHGAMDERKAMYETEAYRDKRYEEILAQLMDIGFKIDAI